MSEMICPICGRSFDDMKYVIADNGNPICPECAAEEQTDEDKKDN